MTRVWLGPVWTLCFPWCLFSSDNLARSAVLVDVCALLSMKYAVVWASSHVSLCCHQNSLCFANVLFIMQPSLRRGPHIASHSVCPSVCPSVPLWSVTWRHLANYNDTRAEGRISYGDLGRTNLLILFFVEKVWKCCRLMVKINLDGGGCGLMWRCELIVYDRLYALCTAEHVENCHFHLWISARCSIKTVYSSNGTQ